MLIPEAKKNVLIKEKNCHGNGSHAFFRLILSSFFTSLLSPPLLKPDQRILFLNWGWDMN